MRKLNELTFDNTYARLPATFHDRVFPTPVPNPYLVSFNKSAADLINLDPAEAGRPEFVDYFSGNRPLPGADPIAMKYAGHQFGVYVPQLGDGRAILLGEVRNGRGEKWDLHLKAGKRPSPRDGGRPPLDDPRILPEAMHGLGIRTTRALCIVGTDLPVYWNVEISALVRMAHRTSGLGRLKCSSTAASTPSCGLGRLRDASISDLAGTEDRYVPALTPRWSGGRRTLLSGRRSGSARVMNTTTCRSSLTLDYGPFDSWRN